MKDTDIVHLEKLLDNFKKPRFDPDKKLSAGILKLAEELLSENNTVHFPQNLWHKYLDITRSSVFLRGLDEADKRGRLAETVFKAIRISHYSLLKLIEQRVGAHPEKPF